MKDPGNIGSNSQIVRNPIFDAMQHATFIKPITHLDHAKTETFITMFAE